MCLSDYAAQGILGALTSAAAETAATAAATVAEPDEMDKIYMINLRGFNIVIPKEGNSPKYLELKLKMTCQYRSLASFRCSEIDVSTNELSMETDGELLLVDQPIDITAMASLPFTTVNPEPISTKRINVDFSRGDE